MFGSKSKGLFFDLAGDTALMARTTGMTAPFVIEELREVPVGDPAELADAVRTLAGVRGSGYATACCAVYPNSRLVARLPIEARKLRDEGYLAQHASDTLKIDAAAFTLVPISSTEGTELAALKTPPKEILVCGAPSAEIVTYQNRLLEYGLFPERLEIGTIATIGGLMSQLRLADNKSPLLLLEIGNESTSVLVLTRDGVEITRSVAFGISSMIPLVQKELALKDEESARKLFFSNSFDFTGMGPQLTKRLMRELQASIGFYEVQTGQSINQLCCTLLPAKVSWLQRSIADVLGMTVHAPDTTAWLKSMGIEAAAGVQLKDLPPVWTSLMCLMGDYKGSANEAAA
jgi:hypothetical protein